MIRRKIYKKGRNPIAPMDFAEYLRKSDVSDNSKVYYDRFLPNGLHESIVIVKADEMYNIWKSASHCLLVER